MERKYGIVSLLVASALVLNACGGPDSPYTVKAQGLPPTDFPTVTPTPSPTESPTPEVNSIYRIPTATILVLTSELKLNVLPFPHFSQNGFGGEKTEDGSVLSEVGCGLVVGAMVTRTSLNAYHQDFLNYFASIGFYGPARITYLGTKMEDHADVLHSLGYTPVELSVKGRSIAETEAIMESLSAQGIAIWINANFYSKGHHSLLEKIDNGTYILNDPLYGDGARIPSSKILKADASGKVVWKVYAIYPLGVTPQP